MWLKDNMHFAEAFAKESVPQHRRSTIRLDTEHNLLFHMFILCFTRLTRSDCCEKAQSLFLFFFSATTKDNFNS